MEKKMIRTGGFQTAGDPDIPFEFADTKLLTVINKTDADSGLVRDEFKRGRLHFTCTAEGNDRR